MKDKRKLIRELLRYNPSENSFFDLKENIDLKDKKTKEKFVKHVCGLSNSNQENDSFLIFGVENITRKIVGSPWRDDSIFQDLLASYISDCPLITYDNVIFPDLPHDKFIGLLTIHANNKSSCIKIPISSFPVGTRFYRFGSQTLEEKALPNSCIPKNIKTIEEIYRLSKVSLNQQINEILEFYKNSSPEYFPSHVVFNDQYVICYRGWPNAHPDAPDLFSEVTINLISENVSLFISAVDYVRISSSVDTFEVTEMAHLYYLKQNHFIPRRETVFRFYSNSDYKVEKRFIFVPPKIRAKDSEAIVSRYEAFLADYHKLSQTDKIGPAETFCDELLISCFNGNKKAENYFLNYLNGEADGCVAEAYHKALEIYEKYNKQEF